MPNSSGELRLLVKMKSGATGAMLRMNGARFRFAVDPLFTSIGMGQERRGVAAQSRWHMLTSKAEPDNATAAEVANPWDICHQLLQEGLGVTGAGQVEFAEPDLRQQWLVGRPGAIAAGLASAPSEPDKQNPSYPTLPDNFWYRDARHAQWDGALAAAPDPGDANRTRIAHLDTGYDPTHLSLPKHLNKTLQRNFVDPDRPNDASDDSAGLFNNLGHGTGTLSILAGAGMSGVNGGKPLGCAPYAEIVPVRVANSVALFYNSAIAKAFDYVHGLCKNPATFVHVITMSMGGLPSQAWADAVNALYEAGVFVVTAAGNNYANLPTHEVVYPARFARVVAACGVMADQTPYADLAPRLMAGNYGPPGKMKTAVAAFTPNVPWAHFGASGIVDFDGNGTSAATPQVAAAAALWIQKNRGDYDKYPQAWMKVEVVRNALFSSAHVDPANASHFGNGKLASLDALGVAPAKAADLRDRKLAPDAANFPTFSLLTGLGVSAVPQPRQAMLELEILQLLSSSRFDTPIPDVSPGAQAIDPRSAARLAEELLAKPGLSTELRKALRDGGAGAPSARQPATRYKNSGDRSDQLHLEMATKPVPPVPAARQLRVYAYDPSLASDLAYFSINEATISIDWEKDLQPGPVGEYLEVVDVDPASGSCYAPVDLNHPHLLASRGYAPSEANPQFHQQMCYAVAMRTIGAFELALGRKALWSSRYVRDADGNFVSEEYVNRLRIYPHALRSANSFYSPEHKALLLGYFSATQSQVGTTLPGSRVFCAVSHDIIAHETTHALLDGLHRRYQESTNPDVLAFHEAFADIVALFQHFSIPESLIEEVRKTRGGLGTDNLLAKLAIQFGQATSSGYGALRDALGKPPDRTDYERSDEPHARGAVLVAAVFAAFVSIYQARAADLVRLATQGTGVLAPGDIPDDLVKRLTLEASKAARHVLSICIRALDYCPPVDITFGEYLRALVTADYDAVPNDIHGYRVAFISAFRDRGIFPSDVAHLAVDSLLWEPPFLPEQDLQEFMEVLDLSWNLYVKRASAFTTSKKNAWVFHNWLVDAKRRDFVTALGFRSANVKDEISGIKGETRRIEVHSVRPARRIGPDGRAQSDIVVEITQSFRPADDPRRRFRGGCTLLIDAQTFKPRYLIRKRLDGSTGLAKQVAFRVALADNATLRSNFYSSSPDDREPFALLHGRH
jgi:Subtilase family